MKQILLLTCVLTISFGVYAQSGSITGKISDSDSYEALPGANVVIKGTSKGTTTDIDGTFSLGELSPGSYALEISFIGYQLKEMIANVRPGQTTNLGVIRLGAASIGLKEVEIIASVAVDRKTPVAFTSIEGQEIEAKDKADEFMRSGIEEWKRIESFFTELERENQLILNAAGEGVYGVNTEGMTTFVNPAAERMLGFSSNELVGKNMHVMVHHHHAASCSKIMPPCQLS